MTLWIVWLIAVAVLLVVELLTGLVASFCLAFGCLLAFVAALAGWGIEVQLVALVAGVIIAFIFLVPFVNRIKKSRRPHRLEYNSNMDALIGREGVLSQAIEADGNPGRLRIDGDYWQARSTDGSPLPEGTRVRVTGYDSIILVVKAV